MVELVPPPEPDDIDIDEVKSAISLAAKRYGTLAAQSEPVDGRQVLNELALNVLPLLSDLASLVDRLEQHAMNVDDEIERLDAGGAPEPESQLLPEDAERYTTYLAALCEQYDESLRVLDPESDQAKAVTILKREAEDLITFTRDLTITPEPEEPEPDSATQ